MYEFRLPKGQYKIVFLEVLVELKDPVCNLNPGDITWVEESYITDDIVWHIEDNRYFENFSKNNFKIIRTPDEYNYLVSDKYKSTPIIKKPKKKLIL